MSLRTANVNLAAANSLFGTIGAGSNFLNGQFQFIPIDGSGGITGAGQEDIQPRWIGLEGKNMQYWAYNYCSPLAAVIDRLAEADTNGRIEFVNNDKDKTTVKNVNKNPKLNRIKNLLKKPNPMQTWEEFNSEQVVLSKIFGYCPVLAICPSGFDKSYTRFMFNINPLRITPRVNENYDLFGNRTDFSTGKWDGIDRENPIKEWYFSIGGRSYTINPKDIILVKDGYISSINPDLGLPLSKVAGLDWCVSNICAAMEADNVLLKKKGPLGVFSYDPRNDMAGTVPMTPKQKTEIQTELSNYGMTLGQLQHIISKVPIKWNPMSFNVRDLMTKETARQGIDGICDRFAYPAELMSGKNATYENRNSAEKYLYQNNIIPFSLRRMAIYNEFFELDEVSIIMDYDHLPVLQEDIMHAGQAFEALSKGLELMWKSGILTFNQVLIKLDLDTITGGDIYYPEWISNNPEIAQIGIPKQKSNNKNEDPAS